jgi:hypothetical protein
MQRVYTSWFPMSDKPPSSPEDSSRTGNAPPAPVREYEKSGLYPANGKPFRLWALLGFLMLVIAVLAGAAALLDILLIPRE